MFTSLFFDDLTNNRVRLLLCEHFLPVETSGDTCVFHFPRQTEKKRKSKWIWWAYLVVDVLVVFDGWALGVVAGGRRGRRETSEQATGVLLLPIYELLHEAFPGAHNHTTAQQYSGAGFQERINLKKVASAGLAAGTVHPNVITFAARFSFCASRQTLSLQKDTLIAASVTGAAADWQMGCKGEYLREWETQLSIN